ncbi:general stress protein [uncultured Hoeflea sp.]|uniref:general stress protein n=1 Tax=uncultured Hoeflea sp. TaxID=538666 RepID=UPI0030EE0330|tara:strand:- start:4508 stop:4846 length:339 start_codon:yes stop_codon:yes gene_type:complete
MTQSAYSNTTEAVGIFHTAEDLQAAIDDLLTQGFNRMDLSILASERAIEDKLHEAYVPARDLEDRVEVPTTAFVSTESVGDAMGAVIGVLVYVPAMIGRRRLSLPAARWRLP